MRRPSPNVDFKPAVGGKEGAVKLTSLLSPARRAEALSRFEGASLGRTEAWWYTPLGERLAPHYVISSPERAYQLTAQEGEVQVLTFEEAARLLNSSTQSEVEGSAQALKAAQTASAQLGSLASEEGEAYCSLNTAHVTEGVILYAPAHTKGALEVSWRLCEPSSNEGASAQLSRLLVLCEEGAQLEVTERFEGFDGSQEGSEVLSNHVTELSLGEGAQLTYTRTQALNLCDLHVGRVAARLEAGAQLKGVTLNLGAALSRVELEAELVGEGADLSLAGAFTGSAKQHLDQHLTIKHMSPRCTSSQRFKGLVGGEARGVFTGKVYVAEGASSTQAFQSNPNLLLTEGARAVTRPQLEIYNDDVECSHGATVGQLDEQALFYLRARGLTQEASERLLAEAFVGEVTLEVSDERSLELARVAVARTLG